MNAMDLMHALDGISDADLLESVTYRPQEAKPVFRRFPAFRLAAVIMAMVLLVGCVAGAAEFSLWNGGWISNWDEVAEITSNHNLQLPQTLLDAPFLDCQFLNLMDKPATQLQSILFPDYRYYCVTYGTETVVREDTSDEYGTGYKSWTERDEVINITFGSTANEHWRRQFGFDETDTWQGHPAIREPIATDVRALNGMTIYLATYESIEGAPWQKLLWYDSGRSLVVELETRADHYDPLLEAADAIMTLNP